MGRLLQATPSPRCCWALCEIAMVSVSDYATLTIRVAAWALWVHAHFLDVLIPNAVPHALVTDNQMCVKYLVKPGFHMSHFIADHRRYSFAMNCDEIGLWWNRIMDDPGSSPIIARTKKNCFPRWSPTVADEWRHAKQINPMKSDKLGPRL